MGIRKKIMLRLTGTGMSLCASMANVAGPCSDGRYQDVSSDIKATISVENYAWASYTVNVWANHVTIAQPWDAFCAPGDPDPDCADPLGRGYPVDHSYLNLNQSHTFTIDRSGLYVGDTQPTQAEFVVATPEDADCLKTTSRQAFIYITSTDSFEECLDQSPKRFLRQYFYLRGYYPGAVALNNLVDFDVYNDIEAHGTVFDACWKVL